MRAIYLFIGLTLGCSGLYLFSSSYRSMPNTQSIQSTHITAYQRAGKNACMPTKEMAPKMPKEEIICKPIKEKQPPVPNDTDEMETPTPGFTMAPPSNTTSSRINHGKYSIELNISELEEESSDISKLVRHIEVEDYIIKLTMTPKEELKKASKVNRAIRKAPQKRARKEELANLLDMIDKELN